MLGTLSSEIGCRESLCASLSFAQAIGHVPMDSLFSRHLLRIQLVRNHNVNACMSRLRARARFSFSLSVCVSMCVHASVSVSVCFATTKITTDEAFDVDHTLQTDIHFDDFI